MKCDELINMKDVFVLQWIERPLGVWELMGSIPLRNSEFFFVSRSYQFTFHKVIRFVILTNRLNVDTMTKS